MESNFVNNTSLERIMSDWADKNAGFFAPGRPIPTPLGEIVGSQFNKNRPASFLETNRAKSTAYKTF
jgi:hypothetical protein